MTRSPRIGHVETWTLRDRGRSLVVAVEAVDGRSEVRLLLEGDTVASGSGGLLDTLKLSHQDLRVKVELWRTGRARSVDMLDHGDDGPPADGDGFSRSWPQRERREETSRDGAAASD